MKTSEFAGFSPETFDFLWGIRLNNNKEWFAEHKKDYVDRLYEPMKALGQAAFRPFPGPSRQSAEGQPHLPGRPDALSGAVQGKSVAVYPAGRGMVGGKSLPVF